MSILGPGFVWVLCVCFGKVVVGRLVGHGGCVGGVVVLFVERGVCFLCWVCPFVGAWCVWGVGSKGGGLFGKVVCFVLWFLCVVLGVGSRGGGRFVVVFWLWYVLLCGTGGVGSSGVGCCLIMSCVFVLTLFLSSPSLL